MKKHRITDHDAAALMNGHAPVARPDLAPLAASVTAFRDAAFETTISPSAELASYLELAGATGVSANPSPQIGSEHAGAPELTGAEPMKKRVKHVFSWLVGLGLTTKIVLGVGVAAAAATGAGAAGVLPGVAQESFDTVVSTVVPSEEEDVVSDDSDDTTEDGEKKDNFGQSVSERAHELGKDSDGRAFGKEISTEAQQLGDEKRQNSDDSTVEDDDANGKSGDHKPENVPNGPKP